MNFPVFVMVSSSVSIPSTNVERFDTDDWIDWQGEIFIIRYALRHAFGMPELQLSGATFHVAFYTFETCRWALGMSGVGAKSDGTFAAGFAALERYHHEEDVIGSRCGRDFGRFRSLARLCWSAHLSRTRR